MILELVATCLLGAGTIYTPPTGWRVEQIGIVGLRDVCSRAGSSVSCLSIFVMPIEQSYVVVRRAAKVGETIEAPLGCTLRAEMKP